MNSTTERMTSNPVLNTGATAGAVLPGMVARDAGHIVDVGSMAATCP